MDIAIDPIIGREPDSKPANPQFRYKPGFGPHGKRKRAKEPKRRPLIVLTPRIAAANSISGLGREADVAGFALAVVLACGERLLRELGDDDNARRRCLTACASYWAKVALDAQRAAPGVSPTQSAPVEANVAEPIATWKPTELRRRREPPE